MRKYDLIICTVLGVLVNRTNGQTPAQDLARHVDAFTGDFTYSVPLLTVPGPNGEAFPLTATYSAGIQTNQEASMVGLGWSLGTGSISRSVLGIPDDWKGGEVKRLRYIAGDLLESLSESSSYFGPVHFKELANSQAADKEMDLYVSRNGVSNSSTSFEFPDYDRFHVSGPGIGGTMQAYMLQYASLWRPNESNLFTYTGYGTRNFWKRPEFRFSQESGARISAPYYGAYNRAMNLPSDPQFLIPPSELINESQQVDQFGQPIPRMTYFSSNCPEDEKVLWASNYVEYFTNSEIENGVEGFLDVIDADEIVDRSLVPDGIGGFRITTANGLIYHYSLPVHVLNEVEKSFILDEDLEPLINNSQMPVEWNERGTPYAVTWLLTAITGQAYVDANSNGKADIGDEGYWMAVEYGKWTDNYHSRSPYYGYHYGMRNRKHQRPSGHYHPYGSVSESNAELYYTKCISTSSHSAYFIYDLRKDNLSAPVLGDGITPSLRVSRIVLINNWDRPLFSSIVAMSSVGLSSGIGSADANSIANETHYQSLRSEIEAVSLQTVEFEHDYSLCKGIYNHSESVVTGETSYQLDNSHPLFASVTPAEDPDENTGRLTLKSIKNYGFRHAQYSPPTRFGYSEHNPTYDHRKKDFYGYYKKNLSHPESGYLTWKDGEASEVDSWSLVEIVNPLGSKLSVQYESDSYTKIANEGQQNAIPWEVSRIFRISEYLKSQHKFKLVDTDGYYFLNPDSIYNWSVRARLALDPPVGTTLYSDVAGSGSDPSSSFIASSTGVIVNNIQFGGDNTFDYDQEILGKGWGYFHVRVKSALGGGLRVKRIGISDIGESSDEQYLEYVYSRGMTTSEPDVFTCLHNQSFEPALMLSKSYIDRHSRTPSVGYGSVTYSVHGIDGRVLGRDSTTFTTYFNDLRPNTFQYYDNPVNQPSWENDLFCYHVLNDYDIAGWPLESFSLDSMGNIISKKEFEYSRYDDPLNGRIDDVFHLFKDDIEGNYNTRVNFHSVFHKKKIYRYLKNVRRFQDGKLIESEVMDRDPLTGAELLVKSTSLSDGTVITRTVPAYNMFPEMGSKFLDDDNSNQIFNIQSATIFSNEENESNTRDANRIEFSKNIDSWGWSATLEKFERRPSVLTLFVPSNHYLFNGESDSEQWKFSGATTMTNRQGRVIESKDNSERYSCIKFSLDGQRAIANAVNARYQEFTHCGFEETPILNNQPQYFEGEVKMNDGVWRVSTSQLRAHSGNGFVELSGGGTNGPSFFITTDQSGGNERGLVAGRMYRASVWVHESSNIGSRLIIKLGGTWESIGQIITKSMSLSDPLVETLGQWKRIEVSLKIPDDYVAMGGPNGLNGLIVELSLSGDDISTRGYFDDLRVQPIDSEVNAFVYDRNSGRVTYSLNNDNIATRLDYDSGGQISKVFIERENGYVKQYETNVNFKMNY